MTATLTEERIRELGRTEGEAQTLAVLSAGQHTRRLLLLRMLLDSVDAATPLAAALAREHADLLETSERAAPDPVRQVLFYPLTGPWAERCVRHLATGAHADATRDLAHLGSLAAAAAIRSGTDFTTRTAVHNARVTLPTLGALRIDAPDGSPAELSGHTTGGRQRLVLRAAGAPPVVVHREENGPWRSPDPRWLPLRTLDGGPRPVFLDDLDPDRLTGRDPAPFGVGVSDTLTPDERDQWVALWREALPLLRLGGGARSAELDLLDCVIPVATPRVTVSGSRTRGEPSAHYSGTTGRAFGAVLSSRPPSPVSFAIGIAHELQHAKLAALTELVPLHTAGPEQRHWAPWRPDPRPFNGLLHGVYAHLALAAFWQRLALALDDPAARDHAWAGYARCFSQVAAALPAVRDSRHLTDTGRVFVQAIATRHEQISDTVPPPGHMVRAAAYVETSRTLWLRQHGR
jgi:HEXXH motif-containing protein